MYVKHNDQPRSRKHCFHGKSINIKWYWFLCICILALFFRHTKRVFSAPCYIVICSLSGCALLYHIIS